ncbi:MAG: amidohydrolase [Erysipelotrichaceae bacterium]|nr:amidohydrolase [Erysipelotrichaceae bacterium]
MNKLDKLSDDIWSYAETGFEETKSCEAMVEYLKEEGFKVNEGIANMPTAYEGVWGSGKPVICFLAEYDALFGMNQKADVNEYEPIASGEDTGHGCGHHLLGTGAIMAAVEYRNWLKENGKEGTVKIVGCPAEESGSGKAYLARDGYFNDCDIALTWHPSLFNQVSTGSSQSCISAFFKFYGVSSHAASAPHLGRSALDAAELCNVGVNYLREHMLDSDRVHYAYTNVGGKAPNVVQSSATLKYFVRSSTNPECEELYKRVINCAKGAALMTDTKLEVVFDEGLSNTITNKVLEDILYEEMVKNYKFDYSDEELSYAQKFKDTYDINSLLNNNFKSIKDVDKLKDDIKNSPLCSYVIEREHYDDCEMGSTDVGDVSWVVPTAQINTACYSYGADAHSWQWVAQGKSSIAHKGYQLAGKVLCDTAIKLHENPELIDKAWDEFNKKMNGQKYKSLIPDDVMPHVSKAE